MILVGMAVLAACWPRRGVLARWQAAQALAARSRREDALKHVLKAEAGNLQPTTESVAGALGFSHAKAAELLRQLEAGGLVSFDQGRLRLRTKGRELALHVIRAHRLWESYLAEQTGVAEEEWHARAERQEHLLSPQATAALAAQLGHPTRDPHGDAIPEADGALPAERGQSLNTFPPHTPLVITHVEDEPTAVYAQLSAEGLRPGVRVSVNEKSPQHIRFRADGREHELTPMLANNITAAPLPEVSLKDLEEDLFLNSLKPGQSARVIELSPACRGLERRRLLDLGFVAGTTVTVEMISPGGDPTAYRLRGTVVALRRDQAGLIRVQLETEAVK
jgi:DtxR family Mn-dependent transcriptional regulator